MVVIGPYGALIVNINDLKSATEGNSCICTREHHNERETHFLYRPANPGSLKIFLLCRVRYLFWAHVFETLSRLPEVKKKYGGSSGFYRVLLGYPGDFELLVGEANVEILVLVV